MAEPVELAKNAREQLSSALNALQSNAHVPDELMAIADPIADTMSVLHRIERSKGADLSGRDEALANVRAALDALQKITVHHPATDVVMEAVALSLSKVHALARYSPPAPAPAPQPAPVHAAPQPAPVQAAPPQPSPTPAPATGPRGTQLISRGAPAQPAAAQQAPTQPSPAAQPAPEPAPVAQPAPQPQAQAYAPAPQPQVQAYAPQAQAQAYAPQAQAPQPQAQAYAQPQPAPQPQAYAPQPAPQPQAPRPQPGAGKPLDCELGTHSASNFYKGLGGNDVIEHGGIFVATYKIPKIGTAVSLRVLLPGDYEFHASAVVQWTREPGGSGESSEPGFGARFTQISPEGRQLVYRYTRNREPIFYDDL